MSGNSVWSLLTWEIALRHFIARYIPSRVIESSDYRRLSGEACPFRVNVSEQSKDGVFLIRTVQHHTCPPVTHLSFTGKSSQKYLQPHLEGIIADDRSMKPCTLQTFERRERKNNANYLAMARCDIFLCCSFRLLYHVMQYRIGIRKLIITRMSILEVFGTR